MTKYARDEFDRVPEAPTRQGVHRAAAESRRRGLGPVLAVGAVALVVGLVAFLFLPKLGFNSAATSSAVTAEQSTGSPSASAPSASSSAQASGTASAPATPSAATTPSDAATTASPEEPAAVDKTQTVAVYNATGTAGLASRVGATVASDGWTLGPLGNWGGTRQSASVIFYNGAQQLGNAEALASLLGIQTVVDSAEFNMPLVVVLGPGFR